MTPEERVRMNELCAAIQEEKDYGNFAGMLREMSELISRKEQRRFKDHPALVWNRNRPFKTVEATVNKIVPTGVARHPEKVEISITPADYLFREVRIENALMNPDGDIVALKPGAKIDVTFEADASDTVKRPSSAA